MLKSCLCPFMKLNVVYLFLGTPLQINKAKVKSITRTRVPSLKLCIHICIKEIKIKCQYLKYQKETQRCLISESKYSNLAGWLTVRPEHRKSLIKFTRLFGAKKSPPKFSKYNRLQSKGIWNKDICKWCVKWY